MLYMIMVNWQQFEYVYTTKLNIQSAKGCRQTFKSYKLAFVYALMAHVYYI